MAYRVRRDIPSQYDEAPAHRVVDRGSLDLPTGVPARRREVCMATTYGARWETMARRYYNRFRPSRPTRTRGTGTLGAEAELAAEGSARRGGGRRATVDATSRRSARKPDVGRIARPSRAGRELAPPTK